MPQKTIKTKSDLNQALADLDQAETQLYQDGALAQAAFRLRREKKRLQEIRDQLDQLRPIKIILTFKPSVEFINHLWESLTAKFGPEYFLDFEIDEDLVAGTVIELEGKYYDFSLRKYF